ncbi:nucleotidyl transferase AbiEii/AbiGii toxin family protein [Patescibacteria group bacterium]|nr:nucleotidyl transferase AbiEii/AbiGii toxin family protein [Patescibacteria group bacterium]MBU4162026.1 nucleotidyl transferase AbiEii/AbiGii toxin family protein [Patescibacteria group bacterium]
MLEQIISKKTQSNLEILKKSGLIANFYLVGGTGLALYLKHRISVDLDFFSKKEFNSQSMIQKIKKLGKFSIAKESENTLTGVFNDTKIAFLTYDYPLLFPLKKIGNINVADIKDIACMKISAISSRGSKKDFIDLYFICQQGISLKQALVLFEKKYKSIDYNMVHILKSLVFFDDAHNDPMPKMLVPVMWEQVKRFFQEKVKTSQ